jgi:hypothetical protein
LWGAARDRLPFAVWALVGERTGLPSANLYQLTLIVSHKHSGRQLDGAESPA